MPQSQKNILAHVEIKPSRQAKRTFIWLHGLGADGHDFVPLVPELGLPDALDIHYIFPHAPMRAITINNGYTMRAWYDIHAIALDALIDDEGIATSVNAIDQLIASQIKAGVQTTNIMLGGFSQGAVIALTTALLTTYRLAGVIGLSGYLPNATTLVQKMRVNQNTPIFLAHGSQDPIVPMALGKQSYDVLSNAGLNVEWHSYPVAHTVATKEVSDLRRWITTHWRD